ncbi:MAG: sugar transferase [Candidatus Rokubacteria bacterium]|nr:sugar transferase [Candidatus Rokubacteria bacterium]
MTLTRLKLASALSFACAVSLGIALPVVGALYVLFPEMLARGPVLASVLIGLGLVLPLHAATYRILRSRAFRERVLIVGTSLLTRKLIEEIEADPRGRYAIVGVADDPGGPQDLPLGYPLLGPLEQIGKIVEQVRPDRIIVALDELRGRLRIEPLLEARMLRGVAVDDGVEVYERLTGKLAIESLTSNHLVFSRDFPKPWTYLVLVRAMSFLASLMGLISLALLFGFIALAIKLDSRGPVFFVQERVGLRGKRFTLVKFRTMRPASGRTSEWVGDNGDRITRVGKWLRKFHLDELPQLVNIVRGDMNLVGPRPHPASNFELFALVARNTPESGEAIPYYCLRSMVRPGITGWAQVRYRYANNLEEEIEKLRYDVYYVKHRSFRLDLRILFETFKIVLLACRSAAPDARRAEPLTGVTGKWTLRKKLDQTKAA